MLSARLPAQTSHLLTAIFLGSFLGMTGDVNWQVHKYVSWIHSFSPRWSTLATTHVSQMNVVAIYLKIVWHPAYIGMLVACSSNRLSPFLLDVAGGRDNLMHGHLFES